MITMQVADENMLNTAEPEMVAPDLNLGAFATIDEEQLFPVINQL